MVPALLTQLSASVQNDLRMAKEKGRRRQAIIARQEEELAVRDRAGEAASAEHTQLQRQLERAQADNKELKVCDCILRQACDVKMPERDSAGTCC